MTSKWIDTHTHLSSSDYDSDRTEVLKRAEDVCDYLIDIGSGMSLDAFEKSRLLAESHNSIYFTAGIHPHDADKLGTDTPTLNRLSELYSHPKCVAVGECGLDYYYKNSDIENQKRTFQWHIDQALKYRLPLMIHTRDAEADTMKLLEPYTGTAVLHCFTGTQSLADFAKSKGFFVSFSGIVTFKNADSLRNVFLSLPEDLLLIETDAPFLAPAPLRGKRNESAFIKHTAQFLANLRGISEDHFSSTLRRNSLKLFSKIIRE